MDNSLIEILNLCSTKFYSELALNKQKYAYYQDQHDILQTYKTQDRRSNQIAQCNFVGVFIDQETSYILGKPVSLVPKNGDENVIMDIDYNLAHWSRKHNQTLCTDLGIYGKVFELYYINEDGEFCARVLNSKTSYAVIDENNIVTLFLYHYRKPFDFNEYVDVYTSNEIITYINNTFQEVNRKVNIFGRVPVAFCHINRTIFDMIKRLNDSYNITLSNGINENSDLRSSFLKITGAIVKEEDIQFFDSKGIINVPKDANIDFLIKELNDAFLKTILQELNDKIYECTGHINFSQQPSSNTSSLALRGRLITLEQRCQLMSDSIADVISTRLKFLFQYLKIKENKLYDYKNIDIRFTPNVPTDLLMLSNMLSQLGGVDLSQETKLSLLPFVENPKLEMQKIKSERIDAMNNLDNFINPFDKANPSDNNDTVPDNGVASDVPNINIGVLGIE